MDCNCTIRELLPTDEIYLPEFLYLAIHVPQGHAPIPREIIQRPELSRYFDGWGRRGDAGVIAEVSGVVVGIAWLRLWTGEARGYGFVNESTPELCMSVLPEFRGQGIGTPLLSDLFSRTKDIFPAISLSVSDTNPAKHLYDRFGFRQIGVEDDSIVMIRETTLVLA